MLKSNRRKSSQDQQGTCQKMKYSKSSGLRKIAEFWWSYNWPYSFPCGHYLSCTSYLWKGNRIHHPGWPSWSRWDRVWIPVESVRRCGGESFKNGFTRFQVWGDRRDFVRLGPFKSASEKKTLLLHSPYFFHSSTTNWLINKGRKCNQILWWSLKPP